LVREREQIMSGGGAGKVCGEMEQSGGRTVGVLRDIIKQTVKVSILRVEHRS
jgi:hypothetical protein